MSRIRLALTLVLPATLLISPALSPAAVGVEKVSRTSGAAGDVVKLTLGCGFCYPPCEGHPARNTPCMLGTDGRRPPEAFPVSLVPVGDTPELRPCGPSRVCSPEAPRPPRHDPFAYVGRAVPPANIESIRESGRSYLPRYTLEFEIPEVKPGSYAFVIYCASCNRGEGGSLLAQPQVKRWRIKVLSPLASLGVPGGFLAAVLRSRR